MDEVKTGEQRRILRADDPLRARRAALVGAGEMAVAIDEIHHRIAVGGLDGAAAAAVYALGVEGGADMRGQFVIAKQPEVR